MLTEALRRRRVEAADADRFVERLFGLELTQDRYDRGAAFVAGVVERAGEEGLERLWRSERRAAHARRGRRPRPLAGPHRPPRRPTDRSGARFGCCSAAIRRQAGTGHRGASSSVSGRDGGGLRWVAAAAAGRAGSACGSARSAFGRRRGRGGGDRGGRQRRRPRPVGSGRHRGGPGGGSPRRPPDRGWPGPRRRPWGRRRADVGLGRRSSRGGPGAAARPRRCRGSGRSRAAGRSSRRRRRSRPPTATIRKNPTQAGRR